MKAKVQTKNRGRGRNWLARVVSLISGPVEYPDSYSIQFQPKQLENGKWCLWNGNVAVSLESPWCTERPGGQFWDFSEGSRRKVHKVARRLEEFERLRNG